MKRLITVQSHQKLTKQQSEALRTYCETLTAKLENTEVVCVEYGFSVGVDNSNLLTAILEQQKKTNELLAAILSADQDEQSYTGTMDDDCYEQDDSETL